MHGREVSVVCFTLLVVRMRPSPLTAIRTLIFVRFVFSVFRIPPTRLCILVTNKPNEVTPQDNARREFMSLEKADGQSVYFGGNATTVLRCLQRYISAAQEDEAKFASDAPLLDELKLSRRQLQAVEAAVKTHQALSPFFCGTPPAANIRMCRAWPCALGPW